jgi:hypothetical protein
MNAVSGWGVALQAFGDLGEGISSVVAAKQASHAQGRAIDDAGNLIRKSYGQAGTEFQPYADIGKQYTQSMAEGVQGGKWDVSPYQAYQNQEAQPVQEAYGQQPGAYQTPQFNYQQDPGYQWQLQQGNQQIQAGAAAQGGLLSGSTQKALAKYGVGLAAQDYNNAFNRYVNNRNFAYQMNQDTLGQFNKNRAYSAGMQEMNLGQYNQNRQFGAGQNLAAYNAATQQAQLGYGRYADLGNLGYQSAGQLADIYKNQGVGLANLELQRGNVNAAGVQQAGQATGNVFNKISKFGSKMYDEGGGMMGGDMKMGGGASGGAGAGG